MFKLTRIDRFGEEVTVYADTRQEVLTLVEMWGLLGFVVMVQHEVTPIVAFLDDLSQGGADVRLS